VVDEKWSASDRKTFIRIHWQEQLSPFPDIFGHLAYEVGCARKQEIDRLSSGNQSRVFESAIGNSAEQNKFFSGRSWNFHRAEFLLRYPFDLNPFQFHMVTVVEKSQEAQSLP
jgi:hypothetical protein